MINTKETLLNAVTSDTTSGAFDVSRMRDVAIQLLASGISAGNGVFTVEGTIDGVNWTALNVLVDNVANTNAEGLTRVASKTLSANGSAVLFLNASGLTKIRIAVDVTTDGAYSALVGAKG